MVFSYEIAKNRIQINCWWYSLWWWKSYKLVVLYLIEIWPILLLFFSFLKSMKLFTSKHNFELYCEMVSLIISSSKTPYIIFTISLNFLLLCIGDYLHFERSWRQRNRFPSGLSYLHILIRFISPHVFWKATLIIIIAIMHSFVGVTILYVVL